MKMKNITFFKTDSPPTFTPFYILREFFWKICIIEMKLLARTEPFLCNKKEYYSYSIFLKFKGFSLIISKAYLILNNLIT